MPILPLASGVVLLFAGRKFFWLIVAILGFLFSFQFIQTQFPNVDQETTFVVGAVLGIAGAILAVFVQKMAIALAGFLAGGLIGTTLWDTLGQNGDLSLFVFIGAGFLGCLLMMFLFDWALVIMTSLMGSALLIEVFELQQQGMAGFLFLGLALLGIFIQSWHSPAKKRHSD